MTITQWIWKCHQLIQDKAPHRILKKNPLELLRELKEEVDEVVTEVQNENHPIYQRQKLSMPEGGEASIHVPYGSEIFPWRQEIGPEGEAIELADVIMRAFTYAAVRGINLEQAMLMKYHYNLNHRKFD